MLPKAGPKFLSEATPTEIAAACRQRDGLVFFDSALESLGALSIVAADPVQILRGHLDRDGDRLREILEARRTPLGADAGVPEGMLAGWVDYDGAFCFGEYESAFVHRHADQSWQTVGRPARWIEAQEFAQPDASDLTTTPLAFQPEQTPADYCRMVAIAQERIAAGDIYQVNLAHRFSTSWPGSDAFAFYESLRHYSPAPFAAYLHVGGRQVLSASPESFLRMSGRGIRTRPIKGTRPRRAEAIADERSAFDLITSAKEIAELVMITDLERSDLGQVCEYGSVEVRELMHIERYEHVFHLVSTVAGTLRPEVDHVTALQRCFPGGSITGAPKKRAREIIAELETIPRGLYTGAIGWFGFNGESQFNIAIRTVVVEGDRAHFHVGAGIVADSQPEREWQETLDKAAGILLAAERHGTRTEDGQR
ncbi:MAG: aminodeoxychorismate synthase component I [Chthoniobacteraceae bacterium]